MTAKMRSFGSQLERLVVCRAWPGCYMVMSGKIMTQLPGKVQTQPDGGEG